MSSAVGFGRYQLVRRLAIGGMAEVFLAQLDGPEGFRRPVVIKRLLPHLARQPEIVDMFLDEARLASRFDHPNLIQIYELFAVAGQYSIAMELLDGIDVGALLAAPGPISPAAACTIIIQAAAGLQHAHDARQDDGTPLGLVHRDISPSNVFITRTGVVKVVDFGIAKPTHGSAETAIRGKPSYMAPEQITGQGLDRRCDIFSLGALAYELITRRKCFEGSNLATVAYRIVNNVRSPITDCPPAIAAIVDRMLQTDPAARYQTAAEVRQELRQAITGLGLAGHELSEMLDPAVFAIKSEEVVRVPTAVADFSTTMVSGELAAPDVIVTDELLAQAKKPLPRRWAPWAGLSAAVALVAVIMVVRSAHEALTAELPVSAPLVVEAPGGAPTPAITAPETPQAALPETPDAAPTSPASPKTGQLTVTSTPPGDVFYRGRKLGRTPLTTSLPAGRAALEIRVVDSAARKTVSAMVVAGQNKAQAVTFVDGTLVVDAKPWAEVYVGDRKLGLTPGRHVMLEGRYTLSLRNPTLNIRRDVPVVIEPNGVTKVFETLR